MFDEAEMDREKEPKLRGFLVFFQLVRTTEYGA